MANIKKLEKDDWRNHIPSRPAIPDNYFEEETENDNDVLADEAENAELAAAGVEASAAAAEEEAAVTAAEAAATTAADCTS